MPTNRVPLRRSVRGRIDADEEMHLWLGAGPQGRAMFADEAETEAAWRRHRDRLLEMFGRHGRRPWAWWRFEAPPGLEYDYARERSILFEAGLLAPKEAEALVAEWREAFERASVPSYSFCAGPGEWLTGRAARAAFFAWADIPASLLARWTKRSRVPAQ